MNATQELPTPPSIQTIDIPAMLPWSEPKRVNTRNGPRLLRKAAPTDAFWQAWRAAKQELSRAGISVGQDRSNNTGAWEVCWWGQIPAEEIQEQQARIEASRATDKTDVYIPKPDGLDYLGYQRAGIYFAAELYGAGKSGCLIGDEMGLGKTIQGIGTINFNPTIKRVLVVCPATLKVNWSRELQKWLTRPMTVGIASGSYFPSTDIVICNYDIVNRFPKQLAEQWDLVICDEVHLCKNAKTIRARALFGYQPSKKEIAKGIEPTAGVNAKRKLALTGTPICNRPMEIFSVLHWLDPQKWDNGFKFGLRYAGGKQTRWGWDFSGATNLEELQRELRASCMVRRLKADVLTELPPKRRQVIEIPADECQDLIDQEIETYRRNEDRLADLKARVELSKASENPEDYAAAVKALGEGATAAFQECALVAHQIALAKVPYVIEHVREAIQDGEKVILFAHHVDVIAKLAEAFPGCAVVTGDVDNTIRIDAQGRETSKRAQQADKFQTDPSCTVFIGNIKAAGVGLTLTKSAHVVFAEIDWVPGNMSQCEDRAHRIGQRNSVLVQHLVMEGSLDVHKAHTLIEKQAVIDRALDKPLAAVEAAEPVILTVTVPVPGAGPVRKASDRKPADRTHRTWDQPVSSSREELEKEAPNITLEQRDAILTGLQILAGVCDGARSWDGAGFNKIDSRVGKSLAGNTALTPRQAALGQKLVCKYQGQLSEDLVERAGVTPKAKKKAKKQEAE
jgi:SWI/SNF-related matrix-associated actin-dependent regulator 1 of chromatin subfamily A